MITRRALAGAGIGSALLQTGGCGGVTERVLRYRLTLRAVVGGRRCEGASVHEVRWRPNIAPSSAHGGAFRLRFWAEAIVMEVGALGPLFGLLSPPANARNLEDFSIFRVFAPLRTLVPNEQLRGVDPVQEADVIAQAQGEHALSREYWPALVRFRDIDDRATAESIQPEQFSATFGQGARFDGAFMEITRARPTRAIEQRLPWLHDVKPRSGQTLTRGRMTAAVSSQLERENFQMQGLGS